MSLEQHFKALSDETRLRILRVLSRGSFNVGEITEVIALTQPTVSHHLRILQRAGFVRARKEGTSSYYALNREADSPIKMLLATELFDSEAGVLGREEQLPGVAEDLSRVEAIFESRRDESLNFFESVASDWDDLNQQSELTEQGLSAVAEAASAAGVVLELGCGSGNLLQRILPREGETIGVDQSSAMLRKAEGNLGAMAKRVDLRLGRLEHLPVGDGSVDIAVSHMVFHHVPSPQEALADAFRTLRPGGRICICELSKHDNEMMRERYGDLWLGFDESEFRSWMETVGFSAVEFQPIGSNGDAFFITGSKEE